MEKYIIKNIRADGYERYAIIQSLDTNVQFMVYFLEVENYVANLGDFQQYNIGDTIDANLAICSVSNHRKVDSKITYKQEKHYSVSIDAVVQVSQILDEYSLYANSSICKDELLVEFAYPVDYKIGDVIYVEGSLSIDKINDKPLTR